MVATVRFFHFYILFKYSVWFFRIVPESFDEIIIRQIAGLGHEVGYHYEDVSLVSSKQLAVGSRSHKGRNSHVSESTAGQTDFPESSAFLQKIKSKLPLPRVSKGLKSEVDSEILIKAAYESFRVNLQRFREIVEVKTICMHGSPLSPFDNRMIWEKYDYRVLGIIGEPYFDIDFSKVLYLTDTGRRWDGESVSVRDKPAAGSRFPAGTVQIAGEKKADHTNQPAPTGTKQNQKSAIRNPHLQLRFHSTKDIIKAAEQGKLPGQIMFTFHPQRWTNRPFPWLKELFWQNMKNQVKKRW